MAFFDKEKYKYSCNTNEEKDVDWLQHLQNMRAKRKQQVSVTDDQQNKVGPDFLQKDQKIVARTISDNVRRRKNSTLPQADCATRAKVYKHYLAQWEQVHNEAIANPEASTQVLLSGKWQLKNDEILLRVKDSEEESQQVIFIDKAGQITETQCATEKKDEENLLNDKTYIALTIIKPDSYLDSTKKLCVIDESCLIDTLKKELKPHLQSLLEGMVSSMLANNYDIMLSCTQRELQSQLPDLIEEVLDRHLNEFMRKKVHRRL